MSLFPLLAVAGNPADALRIAAAVILIVSGIHVVVLFRRSRRHPLEVRSRAAWGIIAIG